MNYRVIEKLQRKGKNMSSFIQVYATSIHSVFYPTNLINEDHGLGYHSLDEKGTFVSLTFSFPIYADKLVTLSFRNRDPRYWVFEGSNDGTSFVLLKNNTGESLCGDWGKFVDNYIGCMSNVEKEHDLVNKGYYRTFRFRMYGMSSHPNEYFLTLKGIDIIGRIQYTCYGYTNRCISKQIIPFISLIVFVMTY